MCARPQIRNQDHEIRKFLFYHYTASQFTSVKQMRNEVKQFLPPVININNIGISYRNYSRFYSLRFFKESIKKSFYEYLQWVLLFSRYSFIKSIFFFKKKKTFIFSRTFFLVSTEFQDFFSRDFYVIISEEIVLEILP